MKKRALVIFILTGWAFLPAAAFALNPIYLPQNLTPQTTINTSALKNLVQKAKEKNTEAFCSNFSKTEDELTNKFTEKREKVDIFLNKQGENLDDARNQRDAKLEESRSLADQERSEWYAGLNGKAADDSDKKGAVQKFQKTVDAAVSDRRDAVDAAILEFRTGVDALLALRKTTMETERDAFHKAFEAALEQAKTDCENGVTTPILQKKFRDNLKAARAKVANDKASSDKLGPQIHALAETRRTVVQKAIADYKLALDAALADLKEEFGDSL